MTKEITFGYLFTLETFQVLSETLFYINKLTRIEIREC